MTISSLNTSTPGSGEVVGTSGPAELKALKAAIKASFAGFTSGNDVCTRTASQLNNSADKTASETITGNWTFSGTLNATGALNIGGQPVATQAWANAAVASYLDAALSSPIVAPGEWNFVNGLRSNSDIVATQAWVAGREAYGAIRANGSAFIPAGGAQTVSLPTALGAENGVTRSATTITVSSAGTYRVSWGFDGLNSGTTFSGSATLRVAIDGVGVTTLGVVSIPTAPGEEYTVNNEGHIALAAGQTVSLQMDGFAAGGSVTHYSFLALERVG